MKSFASDNYASIHPSVLKAIGETNTGHAVAYGDDPWTARAGVAVKKIFGPHAEVFFVFNGTGANVTGLQSMLRSYDAVFCTDIAHVNWDECGALEKFAGAKLIDVPSVNGKLNVKSFDKFIVSLGNEHQAQPRVVTLTQTTERGTVYSLEELRAIRDYAEKYNLYVHIDGARFANAAASLGVSAHELTEASGAKVISLGGTKNGLMLGEAIVVLDAELAARMKFHRKQSMQLSSKMRFIAAQFLAYFENDLWLELASKANGSAKKLEKALKEIPQIKITEQVDANAVFALVPRKVVANLQKEFPFYLWDEELCEARWMCAWDSTAADIQSFVQRLRELLA